MLLGGGLVHFALRVEYAALYINHHGECTALIGSEHPRPYGREGPGTDDRAGRFARI
jgi:hypothetical protein